MEKIDFSIDFYYDETSPSGIRRSRNKTCGKGYKTITAAKDSIAGYKNIVNGFWTVRFEGKRIPIHKIVLSLHGIDINSKNKIVRKDSNPSNNNISNLLVVPRKGRVKKVNNRNKSGSNNTCKRGKRNTSGIVGVSATNNKSGHCYYTAKWCDTSGKLKVKHFSIEKLGIMVAFREAVSYREKMVKELNEQSVSYTERNSK